MTGPGQPPDEPGEGDAPHAEHPFEPWPDLPPLDPSVVVPDDASSLELDAQALRREARAASRQARAARMLSTRRYQRYGLSGPLVALVLLLVAGFGALLTLLGPIRAAGPAPRPLASAGTSPVGSVGGLVPDVSLELGTGAPVEARRVRPAVVVLVPAGCADCGDAVRDAVRQAAEFRLRSLLVVPGPLTTAETARFDALVREAASGLAIPATDPTGALARAYSPSGVTVVVVAADGVVAQVARDVRAGQRFDTVLAPIAFPVEPATP